MASSIASGIPSSARHSRAIAAQSWLRRRKPGSTAPARSTNRFTASYCVSASGDDTASGLGTGSGGTTKVVSPYTPSDCRLVARICTFGHARMTPSMNSAQSSIRCSQLSSVRSTSWEARYSMITSIVVHEGWSCRPSCAATVCAKRAESRNSASSMKRTPSRKLRRTAAATCTARRVLPTPPGPVSVKSLEDASSRFASVTCCRRPTRRAQVADCGCRVSRRLGTAEFGRQDLLPGRRGFAQRTPQVGHSPLGAAACRSQACGGTQRADHPVPAVGLGGEQMPGGLFQRAAASGASHSTAPSGEVRSQALSRLRCGVHGLPGGLRPEPAPGRRSSARGLSPHILT